MGQKDSTVVAAEKKEMQLSNVLVALNQVSSRLSRLQSGRELRATLQLIVEQAAQLVGLCARPAPAPSKASAVVWRYDAATQTFNPHFRVVAGSLEGALPDDVPRPDGFGRQALQQQRRLLSYEQLELPIHPAKRAVGACVLVCYPLIAAEEPVGVLYVYGSDNTVFDELTLLALENLANLAATALYYAHRLEEQIHTLERKVSEFEKLRRASQVINTRTSLEAVLDEILRVALAMTAAQYGSLELYDKEQNCLTSGAVAGRKDELDRAPLPVDEQSVVGWVALHKKARLIPDLSDPQWQNLYRLFSTVPMMRSELAVPLIGSGEEVAGVLNIESPRPQAFTQQDQYLLEMLAVEATTAVQEFHLLEAMQAIAKAALHTEEDELLKLIIDWACKLINVQVGSIWTLLGQDKLILRQSTQGYQWEQEIPLKDSLTWQAIRQRQPVLIADVQTYPHYENRDLALKQKWVSGIVVPLLTQNDTNKALGGFSLYTSHRRDFSDLDQKLLAYLANQAAIAIQNAEEVAELKRSQQLSERENEVMRLLIEGYTNKQIAGKLVVSVNTVKKHVQSIFTKLNVDSRASAVAKVLGRD